MTLNQLRAFLLTVRTGTFTAAAAELQMAQASVSELIRRMEEECGLPLFTRGGRRLVLTTAGEELLPFAEQAVSAVDQGAQAVAAVGTIGRGLVKFGMLRNWRHYGLGDVVTTFHERHPGVQLRVVGQSSTQIAASVAHGELEAGIVVLPVDDTGLSVIPLIRDELLYATADPTVVGEPMTVERMSQLPLVLYDASYAWQAPTRRQLFERAQLAGVRLEPTVELERVEEVLELVAQGVGGTVVPRAIAHGSASPSGLHTVGFAEPLYDTIALVQRRAAILSPAARELAQRAADSLLRSAASPEDRLYRRKADERRRRS